MTGKKCIFEVIPCKEKERWNRIVRSFPHWDIYYLNEYAHSFEIHGDGEALLIYFEQSEKGTDKADCRLCIVVMKKDIAKDERFAGLVSEGMWYDLETPYGYGGFLLQGNFEENASIAFDNHMQEYANENKIVSLFARFYPIYRNEILHEKLQNSQIKYLKDTIYIDTTIEENIMLHMDSKNRNMVRKAIRNGVTIFHDKGEHLEDFIRIYEVTMDNDHATDYYYFRREYYEYLIAAMKENIEFFYSVYEGKIIGASIFFYNEEYMHYHLSGMYAAYRSLAATNLLLYEAACWAHDKGIRLIHLGGGIEADDSLFGFKKQFNKEGRLPFYVGRTIYDTSAYRELLVLRKQTDDSFDMENGFMIQYRK